MIDDNDSPKEMEVSMKVNKKTKGLTFIERADVYTRVQYKRPNILNSSILGLLY